MRICSPKRAPGLSSASGSAGAKAWRWAPAEEASSVEGARHHAALHEVMLNEIQKSVCEGSPHPRSPRHAVTRQSTSAPLLLLWNRRSDAVAAGFHATERCARMGPIDRRAAASRGSGHLRRAWSDARNGKPRRGAGVSGAGGWASLGLAKREHGSSRWHQPGLGPRAGGGDARTQRASPRRGPASRRLVAPDRRAAARRQPVAAFAEAPIVARWDGEGVRVVLGPVRQA
jgi:hypothetical protein